MIDLIQSQKKWLGERVSEYGLTPQLFHGLDVLAETRGATMSEFAEDMFCDASNATGIVDRLVKRGLVLREASDKDRRVKVVRLTPAGARLQKRVRAHLEQEAPPPIAKLSAADQRALRDIIHRALAHVEAARIEEAG
jgi:DNA-binding MarR family transcriptional regulator